MEGNPPVSPISDLILKFYATKPFSTPAMLGALDGALSRHLRDWRRGLRVLPESQEDRDSGTPLGELSLADGLARVAPMKFGMCGANLVGAYDGVAAFLQCSRRGIPPESNLLTVEVVDLDVVEGLPIAEWARNLFTAVAEAVALRYGQARTRAEFDAKNMIRERGSTRAVGVNLKRALPGLYWLNFFGSEYLHLLGLERLATAPAPIVERMGDGVLVGLGHDPGAWDTTEYRQVEETVRSHIGREYFFSKSDPEGLTKAPMFLAHADA